MALFQPFSPGIEVNGATILSIIKGMGVFTKSAYDILEEAGLKNIKDDVNKWYSQELWLNAFKIIAEKTDDRTLYAIGLKIPESAEFPPDIDTVPKALASIDIAYHMNHRKTGGDTLCNPLTQKLSEGIGHYAFTPGEGKVGTMVCENPYPDEFDRGIVHSITEKFADAFAKVDIVTSKPTRTKGAGSTVMQVRWR